MGVNTLAFRLAQHNAFYMVDADCVGILGDNIPWEKNRQWLALLSPRLSMKHSQLLRHPLHDLFS